MFAKPLVNQCPRILVGIAQECRSKVQIDLRGRAEDLPAIPGNISIDTHELCAPSLRLEDAVLE